jgi:transposase, IS5 family
MRRERSQAGLRKRSWSAAAIADWRRIEALVDWQPVDRLLEPIYAATTRPAGLSAAEHGQGGAAAELVRPRRSGHGGGARRPLSFRRFVGLGLGEAVPDHSTICRFRGELVRRGLAEAVFDEINRQLTARGLIVKQGT